MADVFPEPSVSREGALGWVEPSVHWFTEITRDIAVASRANVNHWYANFPDPDGAFSARLQSETDSEHLQAVDELLVHHLLSQRWGDVRYEEQGSGPDFRIYDSGGCYVGGIEVASLFEREDWSAEQRRYGRLADAVNDRIKPTAGYFLRLEIEGDRDPTSRKVVPFLKRHLAVLPDPDHLSPTNRANVRTEIYDEDGVRVTVTFMPMAPGARGRSNPDAQIVGMGPSIGGCVNTAARIRDRIDAKAGSRYEIDVAPFLVAVALHDLFQTDHEMVTAMYGDEAVEIPSGRSLRRNNGVFGIDNQSPNGRNRRLSAVAFLQQVYVWKPDRVGVSVMVNPYAAHDWSPRLLPATRWFGETGTTGDQMQFGWQDLPRDS